MRYYQKLGLTREPFSNSPDPRFLYDSQQHLHCLQQLEIAVRLRRGLNVVMGEIGTGKTTLCRRFVSQLGSSDDVAVHLLLDPYFKSAKHFLRALCSMFTGADPDPSLSGWELKEIVKKALFEHGVYENRLIVLIVDEGQKMTPRCLEVLRELLNYETNSVKLLQIVLFGQRELEPKITRMPNFMDRINFLYRLKPLGFRETRSMIRHRLELASPLNRTAELFSVGAYWQIYRATRGYPRKIVMLCHKVVLAMIIHNRKRAVGAFVKDVIREDQGRFARRVSPAVALLSTAILIGLGVFLLGPEQVGRGVERIVNDYVQMMEQRPRVAQKEDRSSVMLPVQSVESPLSQAGAVDATALTASPEGEESVASSEPVVNGPATEEESSDLPIDLGSVRISFRENISEMIKNIYGVYSKENLARVAQANPHIRDLENVEVGTSVRFPSVDGGERVAPGYWIRFDLTARLDDAYSSLRRLSFLEVPARILPYWNKESGLRFAVVNDEPYPTAEAAAAALRRMNEPLAAVADILRMGRHQTVFLGQIDSKARAVARRDAQ